VARLQEKKSRFEWLQDYLDLDEEARYTEWRIRKSEAEVERWTSGDLSRMHASGKGSRPSRAGDDLDGLYAGLKQCREEQKELLQLIDTFEGLDNQILKLKYVEGMTLEQIAVKLNYAYITIARHHAELRRRLNWLDEWEDRKDSLENRMDY
jgi:DNA-directed RNA polymerase specialized sigma subunit